LRSQNAAQVRCFLPLPFIELTNFLATALLFLLAQRGFYLSASPLVIIDHTPYNVPVYHNHILSCSKMLVSMYKTLQAQPKSEPVTPWKYEHVCGKTSVWKKLMFVLAMKCDLFVSLESTFINLNFLKIKYLHELCIYEIIYFITAATFF
jgi:hypothetical protein